MTRFQAREHRRLQRCLWRCKAIAFHLERAKAALGEATAEQQQLHAETLAATGAGPADFGPLSDLKVACEVIAQGDSTGSQTGNIEDLHDAIQAAASPDCLPLPPS